MAEEREYINVYGARVHNLKDIDVEIPRDSLTVITGLSGSGKSSLAFDTIFAEGQRRYIETFSAYARNFLGGMERPDVDKITGLSPVISIEQKTTNKNPRSTVGTTTEIYDYLRLLYSRAADAYSYLSGEKMVKYTEEKILELLLDAYDGKRIYILAPLVKNRKGHYKELFEQMMRKGYLNVRVDGELCEMSRGMMLERYKNHDIEVVIDKLAVDAKDTQRLKQSLATALAQGEGLVMIMEMPSGEVRHYSKRLMCPVTGLAYKEPDPHNFSFNSPQGACPHCGGLGEEAIFDRKKLLPNGNLSIADGGIAPLAKLRTSWFLSVMGALGHRYDFTINDPVGTLSEEALSAIINGDSEPVPVHNLYGSGGVRMIAWQGITQFIESNSEEGARGSGAKWLGQFIEHKPCSVCGGSRLKAEALQFRIAGKNIAEVLDMTVEEGVEFFSAIPKIARKLKTLLDVGLGYVKIGQPATTLSGGEAQRVKLATELARPSTGRTIYILDEPTTGLHAADVHKLIDVLQQLVDAGNTVLVIEHNLDVIKTADHIIDLGPEGGDGGGYVVAAGTPEEVAAVEGSYTGRYLKEYLK